MFFNTMRGNHLEDKFRFFFNAMHRGAFCQFPFRWIYHYDSNEYTGKETEKNTPLCYGVKALTKLICNILQHNG